MPERSATADPARRTPAAGGTLPRLLVLGGAMLWGTTGTTQALAPSGATPATVGGSRIALGAVALALLATLGRSGVDVGAFLAPSARRATVAGMIAMAAYQVCFFGGVARAGVAVGTVVGIGSAPVFTGVLGAVVRRERPDGVWYVSTALAVLGSALLVGVGSSPAGRVQTSGVVLALGAGAAYAIYTVATKELLEAGRGPVETMAVTFAGGAVLLAPLLVGGDLRWVAEPAGLAAVAWLGVVTVAVAYVLFASGLRRLPAATVATLTLAEPLTAGTLGIVVLGERPGLVAAVGAIAIAGGLLLLAVRPLYASGVATTRKDR